MRLIIIFLFLIFIKHAEAFDFDVYRKNLALAPNDKKICLEMISILEKNKNIDKSLGYLGAYTMIKAKHQSNPLQKFNSFRAGKAILEKAIENNPNDIELRYIRYAIQISTPSFLAYNHNISDDKKFFIENLRTADPKLQADILKLVKFKESKI